MRFSFWIHYRPALLLVAGGILLASIDVWFIHHYEQNQIEFKDYLKNRQGQVEFFDMFEFFTDYLQPKDYYKDVVTVPLFIEGRKPISVADSLNNTDILDLKLTGVIKGSSEFTVLLQDGKKNNFHLQKGDVIFGWEIIDVQSEWIKLSNQGKLYELWLVEPDLSLRDSSIP